MSYSCEISFKKIDAKDMFSFLKSFKLFVNEHLDDIAKENFHYCPLYRKLNQETQKLSKVPKDELDNARNWIVNGVFKFRYFYDNERGQLGIYGVPDCTKPLFDGSVYFQNSTDQDYQKEEYKGIEDFEKIFDYWMSMDEKTFFKTYYEKYGESCDREYMDEEEKGSERYFRNFEYIKRSVVYKEIWGPISDTLFDDESALYLSLYGPYDIVKQNVFLSCCYEEQVKWEEDFNKRYPSERPIKTENVEHDIL